MPLPATEIILGAFSAPGLCWASQESGDLIGTRGQRPTSNPKQQSDMSDVELFEILWPNERAYKNGSGAFGFIPALHSQSAGQLTATPPVIRA